jgi:23S rRNA (uracil1939-C5)-methyltransferase
MGPGYRHRVRLSVRGRTGSPKVGIFREGTHDLVDIPHCVVHHPLINTVVRCLKAAVRETRTAPYSDRAHAGLLRAVQVVVERSSQTAQVVLVANGSDPAVLESLCAALREGLGPGLHSIWFNGNPERTNRVLGPVWHCYWGPEAVEDTVGGVRVFYPPDAFGQANPELADRIVDEVHGAVPSAARVLELYAGVGAIGLGLVSRSRSVCFNELGPGSLRGLRRGWEELSVSLGSSGSRLEPEVEIVEGPAELAVSKALEADVVIVDPPRKGLGTEVCRVLREARPKRLVYVSCGLASFEQEAPLLSPTFRLESVTAYGLFPFTDHVETVAFFGA